MKNFARKLLPRGQIVAPAARQRVHSNWRLLVHLYSRLRLTKAKDTLIALSGLAKTVREAMEDEYLAGIWRDDLAHGLLWERTGHSERREIRNSAEWIAPSWSWASTSYIVTWDDHQ